MLFFPPGLRVCLVVLLSGYLLFICLARYNQLCGDYCLMIIILGLGEWIQVDLRNPTRVVAVITQGLNYPGTVEEWVTSYKISYGNSTTSLQVIQSDIGSDLVSFCLPNFIKSAGMQTQTNF